MGRPPRALWDAWRHPWPPPRRRQEPCGPWHCRRPLQGRTPTATPPRVLLLGGGLAPVLREKLSLRTCLATAFRGVSVICAGPFRPISGPSPWTFPLPSPGPLLSERMGWLLFSAFRAALSTALDFLSGDDHAQLPYSSSCSSFLLTLLSDVELPLHFFKANLCFLCIKNII